MNAVYREDSLGKHEKATGQYLLDSAKSLQETLENIETERKARMVVLDREYDIVKKEMAEKYTQPITDSSAASGQRCSVDTSGYYDAFSIEPGSSLECQGYDSLQTIPQCHISPPSSLGNPEREFTQSTDMSPLPNIHFRRTKSSINLSESTDYMYAEEPSAASLLYAELDTAQGNTGLESKQTLHGQGRTSPISFRKRVSKNGLPPITPMVSNDTISSTEALEGSHRSINGEIHKLIIGRQPRSFKALRRCSSQELHELTSGRKRTSVAYMYGQLRIKHIADDRVLPRN